MGNLLRNDGEILLQTRYSRELFSPLSRPYRGKLLRKSKNKTRLGVVLEARGHDLRVRGLLSYIVPFCKHYLMC